ncbi:hypothetical protein [Haloarcula sp. K1]|uniref:hypothetical protein n=1 Tax=Haloarcula sp. K1 TaxID=1622207 RepID=UPI0007BAF73E|nr:hypothetical protein [Haloarcula sp. K1]KZX49296.1 hypothetical protein AV929_12185 [Haloarcula sp. K1]
MSAAKTSVTIEFDLEFETDPVGATLDIAVPSAPSDEARQALLDNVEQTMVGARDNLVFQSVQRVHGRLERYAGRVGDYKVESLIESFAGVDYQRDRTSIHVEWSWAHEAFRFMEFGTSDHTVEGDPLLVFEFDAGEYPYLEDMFGDGPAFLPEVEVSGLPEARAVRDSLNWLRREVGQ